MPSSAQLKLTTDLIGLLGMLSKPALNGFGSLAELQLTIYQTAGLENIQTQCLFAYVIVELMTPGSGISVSLTHKIP